MGCPELQLQLGLQLAPPSPLSGPKERVTEHAPVCETWQFRLQLQTPQSLSFSFCPPEPTRNNPAQPQRRPRSFSSLPLGKPRWLLPSQILQGKSWSQEGGWPAGTLSQQACLALPSQEPSGGADRKETLPPGQSLRMQMCLQTGRAPN